MSDTFKAIRIDKDDEKQKVNLVELNENDLMEGDVLVDITHSTLNFKDGLVLTGSSPVVRTFPMIPGIDFSGVVKNSYSDKFSEGDRVVLNGYG